MNILQRKNRNEIENINVRDLEDILYYRSVEGLPEIDSIVFDTILLTNETRIKCIKHYYSDMLGNTPKKGKLNNTCNAIQRFYKVNCLPYDCVRCHRIMLTKRNDKLVKPR